MERTRIGSGGTGGTGAVRLFLCAALPALALLLTAGPADALFLAPCLWRPQRGIGKPSSGTPASPASASPASADPALIRFMSTDADVCKLLCKSPLAPVSACQRCCEQGQQASAWGPASWGQGGLFGAFGWQPPTYDHKPALGTPTVPLVPLSQLTAAIGHLFGVKPWSDGNATLPAGVGGPNNAPTVIVLPGASVSAAHPAQPAQPVQPAQQVQPAQPVEPATVVQPLQTVHPAPVVQPAQPVEPAMVVQPLQTVHPVPVVQPALVVQPTRPARPAHAEKPAG